MFWWQCVSIHLCGKKQTDRVFILSLFCQSTSTCFGHICSSSSRIILSIYNNWYVLCFSFDCLLAGLRWNCCSISTRPGVNWKAQYNTILVRTNCCLYIQHNTYQLLYIYRMSPDDGLQICPKRVKVDWRKKLGINSVSSWFFIT